MLRSHSKSLVNHVVSPEKKKKGRSGEDLQKRNWGYNAVVMQSCVRVVMQWLIEVTTAQLCDYCLIWKYTNTGLPCERCVMFLDHDWLYWLAKWLRQVRWCRSSYFEPILWRHSGSTSPLPAPPPLLPVIDTVRIVCDSVYEWYGVRPSVHLHVPSIDRCSSVRQVCCCGPSGHEISIDCFTVDAVG